MSKKRSKVSRKKIEYEEMLNNIFETNIKWSKLSESDLEKIADILSDSRKCLKVLLKVIDIEDVLAEIIKEQLKKRDSVRTVLELLKIGKEKILEKI